MKRISQTTMAMILLLGCDKSDDKPSDAADDASKQPQAEAPATPPSPAAEQPNEAKTLSLADALATAAKKYPDAPAIEVEIEQEDGTELLEVEFLVESVIKEVYLDPQTGEVVKEADEDLDEDEKATLPALAKALEGGEVTLAQMITMAESKYDSEAIREIELEMHDGKLVMEVGVTEGGETVEWIHDPKTGESLGKEEDEGENEAAEGP